MDLNFFLIQDRLIFFLCFLYVCLFVKLFFFIGCFCYILLLLDDRIILQILLAIHALIFDAIASCFYILKTHFSLDVGDCLIACLFFRCPFLHLIQAYFDIGYTFFFLIFLFILIGIQIDRCFDFYRLNSFLSLWCFCFFFWLLFRFIRWCAS